LSQRIAITRPYQKPFSRLPTCLPNCRFAHSLSAQKPGNHLAANFGERIFRPGLFADPFIHVPMNVSSLEICQRTIMPQAVHRVPSSVAFFRFWFLFSDNDFWYDGVRWLITLPPP
jgi:hypothetical protein